MDQRSSRGVSRMDIKRCPMHHQSLSFRHPFETGPSGAKAFRIIATLAVLTCYCWQSRDMPLLQAQQVKTDVASQSLTESFFEYQGTSWTLVGPSGFARFGPAQRQVSQVPVFDASPPAIGLYYDGGRTRGEFYGYWSHGVQRSQRSIDLSQTLSDGVYGSFACQSLRPFVTGFRPVFASSANDVFPPILLPNQFTRSPVASIVADKPELPAVQQWPMGQTRARNPDLTSRPGEEPPLVLGPQGVHVGHHDSANREAEQRTARSSAERVVMSVDEARRAHQAELDRMNQIAQSYLDLSQSAARVGRLEQARIYLRLAEQYASGHLRERITQLQQELEHTEK